MSRRRVHWAADTRYPPGERLTAENLAQVPSGYFDWAANRYVPQPQGMQGFWNSRRGQWHWRNGYQWGDASGRYR